MDIDDIKCEEKVKTVNILGTEYTIEHRKEADDPKLADGIDSYCDTSVKLLVICDFEQDDFMHSCMNQGWMPTSAAFKAVGQPMKK